MTLGPEPDYIDYAVIKRHVGHRVICAVIREIAEIQCADCEAVLARGNLHIELAVEHDMEQKETENRCPNCQRWLLGRYKMLYCTWCGHFLGPRPGGDVCTNGHPMGRIESYCEVCGAARGG